MIILLCKRDSFNVIKSVMMRSSLKNMNNCIIFYVSCAPSHKKVSLSPSQTCFDTKHVWECWVLLSLMSRLSLLHLSHLIPKDSGVASSIFIAMLRTYSFLFLIGASTSLTSPRFATM